MLHYALTHEVVYLVLPLFVAAITFMLSFLFWETAFEFSTTQEDKDSAMRSGTLFFIETILLLIFGIAAVLAIVGYVIIQMLPTYQKVLRYYRKN